MRGKVLGFDAAGGTGAISGGDGKRYSFTRGEWRGDGSPTPGVYVDFDSADGATATALFPEVKTVFAPGRPLADAAPPPPPPAPHPGPQGGYPGQGQPGGYAQPGGPSGAPQGYGQPGGQPGGYPPPGGHPPYPGQPPAYPGQQPQARQPFPGQAPSPSYPGAGGGYPGQQYPGQQHYPGQYSKSKIAAGLLALFLGTWGIHKFYLGYTTAGVIMLVGTIVSFVLTIVVIGILGLMAFGIIGFVEAIIYLTKSDEEFNRIYVQHQKPWF